MKEHRATSPENAGNLDQVKTDALQLRALISVVLMEVEEKCDSQTLDQVLISYLNIYTVKIISPRYSSAGKYITVGILSM